MVFSKIKQLFCVFVLCAGTIFAADCEEEQDPIRYARKYMRDPDKQHEARKIFRTFSTFDAPRFGVSWATFFLAIMDFEGLGGKINKRKAEYGFLSVISDRDAPGIIKQDAKQYAAIIKWERAINKNDDKAISDVRALFKKIMDDPETHPATKMLAFYYFGLITLDHFHNLNFVELDAIFERVLKNEESCPSLKVDARYQRVRVKLKQYEGMNLPENIKSELEAVITDPAVSAATKAAAEKCLGQVNEQKPLNRLEELASVAAIEAKKRKREEALTYRKKAKS